jgi:hypothetical protein
MGSTGAFVLPGRLGFGMICFESLATVAGEGRVRCRTGGVYLMNFGCFSYPMGFE